MRRGRASPERAEGAARDWASVPRVVPPAPPVSAGFGCPQYALPGGGPIKALGWHGNEHKWFKATTVALRAKFPRLHVKYLADAETGATHPLALPTPVEAYLHAGQIAPWP